MAPKTAMSIVTDPLVCPAFQWHGHYAQVQAKLSMTLERHGVYPIRTMHDGRGPYSIWQVLLQHDVGLISEAHWWNGHDALWITLCAPRHARRPQDLAYLIVS